MLHMMLQRKFISNDAYRLCDFCCIFHLLSFAMLITLWYVSKKDVTLDLRRSIIFFLT